MIQRIKQLSIILLIIIQVVVPTVASAAEAKGTDSFLVQVQGVPSILEGAIERSSLEDELELSLRVYLQLKDNSGFQANNFLDPLTAPEVKQQFGHSQYDIRPLSTYFSQFGIEVGNLNATGTAINLKGTVQELKKAFHTELKRYQKGDIDFYANKTPIFLPERLRNMVTSITGFDNYPRRHSFLIDETPFEEELITVEEIDTKPSHVDLLEGYDKNIFHPANTPLTLTFQLLDSTEEKVQTAGYSLELAVFQQDGDSPSSSLTVSGEGITSEGNIYTGITDSEGQVSFTLLDTLNEKVKIIGYLPEISELSDDLSQNVAFSQNVTVYYYEEIGISETLNTSFERVDSVPTGQNLLVNTTGLPVGSTLENVVDVFGQYQYRGVSVVETKPRSSRADPYGISTIRLKINYPVEADQFTLLYGQGSGNGRRYYSSKFIASWIGDSVLERGLTPEQVNTAYNAQEVVSREILNPGANIAILASADWIETDIVTFFDFYNLPMPNLIHKYVDTSGPLPTYGELLDELELDIERAGSAAPGANLYIYQQPWERPLIDALAAAIADNEVSVISSSIGMYESEMLPEEIVTWQNQMAIADAEGITVVFASGDTGAYGNWLNPMSLETNFPSLENITSVGGSQLGADRETFAWRSEEAWSPSGARGLSQFWSGGGGFSQIIPRPNWQPAGMIQGDSSHRGMPDIVFQSSRDPGYSVYIKEHWATMGGTSAAAPTWAGYVGALSHQLNQRFGNMNPLLYSLSHNEDSQKTLNTIRVGNNGYYVISDSSEWNPVTGLGSVNIGELEHQLSSKLQKTMVPVVTMGIDPLTKAAGIYVGIDTEITSYQIIIHYDPELIEIKEVQGSDGVTPSANFSVTRENPVEIKLLGEGSSGISDAKKLVFLSIKLVGSCSNPAKMKVDLLELTDEYFQLVSASKSVEITFNRGKIYNDYLNRSLTIIDAVAGIQYLKQGTEFGIEEGKVNLINMASIFPPESEEYEEGLGMTNIVTLLETIVGLRDEFLKLRK